MATASWILSWSLDSSADSVGTILLDLLEQKTVSGCKKKTWAQEEKACMDKTVIDFLVCLLSAKMQHFCSVFGLCIWTEANALGSCVNLKAIAEVNACDLKSVF